MKTNLTQLFLKCIKKLTMQHKDAKRLAESTTAEQKKNCKHTYEKEYFLGADTGDQVCSKCGHIK